MAGAAQSSEDDGITGINVTPFVDIALVLLIIFMVTAKYIVAQSIPVDLPSASTSQTNAVVNTANVSVDRSQQIFIDQRPVNEQTLVEEMRRRHQQNPEIRVVIAADRTVQHGRFTQVVDLVRQAGITHFAIQTEPPQDNNTTSSR